MAVGTHSRRAGALVLALAAGVAAAAAGAWRRLPSLPDPEGFAGSFAGRSGDALLVAGGANFPNGRPWEGGRKVWHDRVFVLDRPEGAWREVGRLPRPLGYGVSADHSGGLVCVGGSDATRHHAEVFRLRLRDGVLERAALPPLPRARANGCGARLGRHLYVAGGQAAPDGEALSSVYRLDLEARNPAWETLPPLPEPRILATAAVAGQSLFVVGGAALLPRPDGPPERRYAREAWRYRPGRGWSRIADLPRPSVAAPSPAPAAPGGFLLLGGDDGSLLATPPARHPGFPAAALRYRWDRDAWEPAGALPAPRVTVPVVRWRGLWVLPSGEARPGVRSPEVWALGGGN